MYIDQHLVIDVTTPLKAEEDDFSLEGVDGCYLVRPNNSSVEEEDEDDDGGAGASALPAEHLPLR